MGEVNYAPLIDDMVWSYSRIKAFEDCPYRWYLKYIKKFHGKDMFFSSYGTFMHKLIELYHKGEKTPRQIVDMYLQDFKTEVVGRAPNRKVFSSYFTGGLQYLKALQPFPYGMVGVEKKVDFVVNGIPFVGYIDFLGEKDGDLYVVDNKSRILKPRSSRAKPTKADEELDAYLRQLYTGYYFEEVPEWIQRLATYGNVIVKFGRYIPNQKHIFDEVLGVELASDNQYAERFDS